MKKIVVFAVYYGNFPTYFPLFLLSCKYNNTIDFVIVTDNKDMNKLYDIPENVKIVNITLQDIKQRLDKVIGFDTKLTTPYKLCDVKVMYGEVFNDYVKDYDFWGYCDIDLIFGDIRHFLTDKILEFAEKCYVLGHFSLYKNSDKINKLFMYLPECKDDFTIRSGFYNEVLSTPITKGFDETRGIYEICKKKQINLYHSSDYADLWIKYTRFKLADHKFGYELRKNYDYQVFYWENGKIMRSYLDNEEMKYDEFVYIHHLPKKCSKNRIQVPPKCTAFWITNKGFFQKENKEVTIKDIKKYNPFYGKLFERLNKHYLELKSKLTSSKKRKFILC